MRRSAPALALAAAAIGLTAVSAGADRQGEDVVWRFWPPPPGPILPAGQPRPRPPARFLVEPRVVDALEVSAATGPGFHYGHVATVPLPDDDAVSDVVQRTVAAALPRVFACGEAGGAGRAELHRVERASAHALVHSPDGESQTQIPLTMRASGPGRPAARRILYNVTIAIEVRASVVVVCGGGEERHGLRVEVDRHHGHTVLGHWRKPDPAEEVHPSAVEVAADGEQRPVDAEAPQAPASLSVLSYNLWNTNPPAYLWGQSVRAKRYWRRVAELRRVIAGAGADVVALQEVRLDHTVPPLEKAPSSAAQGEEQEALREAARRHGPAFAPAQVLHVQAPRRGERPWHYVYQPAMLHWDPGRPLLREEEGVAVLSRHPVSAVRHFLLPREVGDPTDGHQRICLHVALRVPGVGAVDVLVTHLGLSAAARERAVRVISDYAAANCTGAATILTGDMNAEPHERSMRFLRVREGAQCGSPVAPAPLTPRPRPPARQGEAAIDGAHSDFRDAWLELHPEPEPRSKDAGQRRHALTFPSDDPVKRIDYIYARGDALRPVSVHLVGQDPAAVRCVHPPHRGVPRHFPASPLPVSPPAAPLHPGHGIRRRARHAGAEQPAVAVRPPRCRGDFCAVKQTAGTGQCASAAWLVGMIHSAQLATAGLWQLANRGSSTRWPIARSYGSVGRRSAAAGAEWRHLPRRPFTRPTPRPRRPGRPRPTASASCRASPWARAACPARARTSAAGPGRAPRTRR